MCSIAAPWVALMVALINLKNEAAGLSLLGVRKTHSLQKHFCKNTQPMKRLLLHILMLLPLALPAQRYVADSLYQRGITYQNIGIKQALELLHSAPNDYVVLDVRTAGEYTNGSNMVWQARGRVKNALFLGTNWQENLKQLEPHKGRTILTICSHSYRSRRAAEYLTAQGYTAMNITGGMAKWQLLQGIGYIDMLGYEHFDTYTDNDLEGLLPATALADFLDANPEALVLDVRDFEGEAATQQPMDKRQVILVYGQDANDNNAYALLQALSARGFTEVAFLAAGAYGLANAETWEFSGRANFFEGWR